MATQQQQPVAATSSEDGTSSYSSYSGTNSYTGQSSLTSSVQIHNYNEVDENSTLDSKPAAFENGLQSLTTNSLIQQRIQQQGEVSACSTNTKEFSLPSSFGGGAGTDGSTINDTIASDTIASNDNDEGSSTRASASIGSRNTQQERNDLLQKQQQQMEVYNNSNQELVSVNSSSSNLQLAQDDNVNNSSKEDQLTIRISKETKPMMHLLCMLKEMDTNDTDTTTSADNHNNQLSINNTNDNPKNKAISSLISDFEQEVTLIEHRIKDESIVTYDNNNNNEQSSTSLVSKASSSIQPLPVNWIALEDPNSGDVYYANEVTGVTQWERPGSTNNSSSMNDSRSTFNDSRSTFNDSYNQSGTTLNDSYNQSLQGSNLSNNNNYKQQSTTSTTFIGNVIQKSDILRNNSQLVNSYQDSFQDSRQSNSNSFQDSQQSNNMSSSYTNMSSSLNDSNFTSTTETTTTSTNIDNNDLPPDWIAIIDSDTGETYYANEVTGESTWEKPISHQQQPHQSVPQDDNVSGNNNDDNELPDGWVELQDEDSGDIYYLNQMTMTTTWDRPNSNKKEVEEDVNSNNKETGGAVDDGTNENDNRPQEEEDEDEDLPPGWFTAVDQDSGDTYYCNEATGETTWDKPTMSTTSIEETSDREQHTAAEDKSPDDDHFGSSVGDNMRRLSISGDFENSDNDLPSSTTSSSILPLGWFAAVDEQSGDTYYCNEATGETTWDLPTQPAIVDDTISSNTNSNSNQGESQDNQLPNGWFSVTDPASGDVYYCNEVTGETTWDKPTIDKATTDLLLSRTSNNVDPTVYEDDSVTSSKGY